MLIRIASSGVTVFDKLCSLALERGGEENGRGMDDLERMVRRREGEKKKKKKNEDEDINMRMRMRKNDTCGG
jgi:hypothetical protein